MTMIFTMTDRPPPNARGPVNDPASIVRIPENVAQAAVGSVTPDPEVAT